MTGTSPFPAHRAQLIVDESLRHLLRLIGPKGRFVYAHRRDAVDETTTGYNLLRHCGTLWFMLRAVNDLGLRPAPPDAAAIALAIGYAGRKLVAPGWAPGLALESKGKLKLGGAGLALAMLAEARVAVGRGILPAPELPLPLPGCIAALADYTLSQLRPDGDFEHKRDLATGGVEPFRSGYYTGEALLGLLLAGTDPARLAESFALLTAQGYGIDVQSHWMAYAACEAVERGALPHGPGVNYITALGAAICNDAAYRARRQSTPIACRSEALTRMLLLDDHRPGLLPPGLAAQLARTASENLALQLDWYRAGQFWKGDGDDKVQIDYIQHNATSYLNWHLHLTA